MRDLLQTGARRVYSTDRSNGACIVYADPADPRSGRVWPRAIPPHLSPCRVDRSRGLGQHRCSASHADVVAGYRAWRDAAYAEAEAACNGYTEDAYGRPTEEARDYWSCRQRPTFGAYLQEMRRTG